MHCQNKFFTFIIFFLLSSLIVAQSEDPETDITKINDSIAFLEETDTTAIEAKENLGFNVGAAASIGLLSGATFTEVPVGATIVIGTPYGFKIGPFDYAVSLAFGGYSGTYNTEDDDTYDGEPQWIQEFNPTLAALGGNLTVAQFVFAEGHVGLVGEGPGFRGFAGVSLERLFGSLNLPVNVLLGSELFISNDMAGVGNSSGWVSLGARLDYSL